MRHESTSKNKTADMPPFNCKYQGAYIGPNGSAKQTSRHHCRLDRTASYFVKPSKIGQAKKYDKSKQSELALL